MAYTFLKAKGYEIGRKMKQRKIFKISYYYIVSGMFVPFAVLMMPLVKETAQLGIANRFVVIVLVKVPGDKMQMPGYIENGIVADYQDHNYPSEMSVDAMIQTYLMDDSADATDTFMKRFDKEWIRYNRDIVAKVKAYEEGNDHE